MKKLIICTLLLVAAIQASAAEKYAVLITGDYAVKDKGNFGSNPNRAFWDDTYLMWETLMDKGYKNENIFVIFAGGQDFPQTPQGGFVDLRYRPNKPEYGNLDHITDYSATKANVQAVFNQLQSKSTTDDFLFVWTFDHGSSYDIYGNPVGDENPNPGVNSAINLLNNEVLMDYELKAMVDPIQVNKKYFSMQQCYSGGFVDDLQGTTSIVNTACGGPEFYQLATQADNKYRGIDNAIIGFENEMINNIEYPHGEYNLHHYNADNGKTPTGLTTYPKLVNGNIVQIPLSAADINNDGIVSAKESADWEIEYKSVDIGKSRWSDEGTIGRETTLQYPTIFFQDPTNPSFQNKIMKGISAITTNAVIATTQVNQSTATVTIENGGDCTILPGRKVSIGLTYDKTGSMIVKKANLKLDTGAEIVINHASSLYLADATVYGGRITVKSGGYLDLSANTKLYGTTIDVEADGIVQVIDIQNVVDAPMIAEGSVLNIKQSGFVYIFGDATLEVQGTMIVAPRATLQNMSSNSTGKIAVTGKLNINGTADGKVNITGFSQGIVGYKDLAEIKIDHAIFSNMNTAVSGTGKELSLTNSAISNCANGVNLVSFSKYNVSSSTFTGNNSGVGITVNLSGDRGGSIYGNTLQSWNKGIAVISCAPTVANNTITNNVEHGIYVAGSNSIPDLMQHDFTSNLNNTIYNNGLNGSRSKAQIFLDVNARATLDYGYNNIYSNLTSGLPVATCVYNNNSGFSITMYARNNYWGSTTVTSSFFAPTTGNWIMYSPYSTIPYTNNKAAGELTEAQQTILSADQDEEAGMFKEAEAKYSFVVEKYPDTQEGYTASSRLLGNYAKGGRDLASLKSLYEAKSADDVWQDKKYFAKMIIKTDMNMENYDLSIAGSEAMKTAADSLNEKLICDLDIAVATMLKNGSNKAVDYNCARDLQNISNLTDKLLGNATGSNSEQLKPVSTNLLANYPNPFNPTTTINYTLTAQAEVKVAVFNVAGKEVASLASGIKNAGQHKVEFNGANLASGVYFCKLLVNGQSMAINKVMLLK